MYMYVYVYIYIYIYIDQRQPSKWIPFGDHPLTSERCRED